MQKSFDQQSVNGNIKAVVPPRKASPNFSVLPIAGTSKVASERNGNVRSSQEKRS